MKKGLVMEGGAMRGMFTAGVIDVMMEHQITFDGAMGVSAGAVFGCNYKSNQPGRVIRYNAAYCNKPQYAGLRTFLKTGDMFGEQFCYHDIPEHLDPFDYETYRKNPMDFYVVVTDAKTGKALYKKVDRCDKKEMEWMRASASTRCDVRAARRSLSPKRSSSVTTASFSFTIGIIPNESSVESAPCALA